MKVRVLDGQGKQKKPATALKAAGFSDSYGQGDPQLNYRQ